jgi:hypothetical protein
LDPKITFQVQLVTTLVDKRVAVTLKYFILINLFLFANHRGLISLDNNRRKFVKFQRSFSRAIAEYQLGQPKSIEIRFAKMVVIFSRRFQAEEDDPPVVPRQLQAEPGLEVNINSRIVATQTRIVVTQIRYDTLWLQIAYKEFFVKMRI